MYFAKFSIRNIFILWILKTIILGCDFFSNSYIFEGWVGTQFKYKKSDRFYKMINQICIIFLFLLYSLFSADKNVDFFCQCNTFCCYVYRILERIYFIHFALLYLLHDTYFFFLSFS